MAYSNINRDKEQAKTGKTIKTAILAIVLSIVTITAGNNIYNQWATLRSAVTRNREIGQKIKELETENKRMEKQIEYATSSANISRKIREYTGYGGSQDYWLILPKNENDVMIGVEGIAIEEKPVIIQWRDLFTK